MYACRSTVESYFQKQNWNSSTESSGLSQ